MVWRIPELSSSLTWTKKVFCREKKAWSMFEIYMNSDSDGKDGPVLKLKIKDRDVIFFVEDHLRKCKTIVRISWETKQQMLQFS